MLKTKTVAVVDDDEAFLDAMSTMLTGEGINVLCYTSAECFISAIPNIFPNCVLIDVNLQGRSGINLFRYLRDKKIITPVIIVTGYGSVPLAVEALREGAVDFVQKPFDPERLLSAIARATSVDEADRIDRIRFFAYKEHISKLTPRERDVMEIMIKGTTSKGIAEILNISPRTVEIYRANVMHKMKTSSLVELIRQHHEFDEKLK